MTKRCTICDNQARVQIETALLGGTETQQDIAARFGTTRRALGAHFRNHMDRPLSLVQASEITPLELTGTPRERMDALITKAGEIMAKAEAQSSVDTQVRSLAELRKVVELMEKLAGRMPPDTKTEILQIIMPNTCKECGRKIELHD